MSTRASGFTLIELMIVVVVVAILASIAVPAYQGAMQKSRRSDAISALLNLQLEQEKFRANCTQYADAIGGGGCDPSSGTYELDVSTSSPDGHYDISIDSASTTTFVAEAAPAAGGAQTGDGCGTFAVNQDGPVYTGTYAGANCWGR